MIHCRNCGAMLDSKDKFCALCGTENKSVRGRLTGRRVVILALVLVMVLGVAKLTFDRSRDGEPTIDDVLAGRFDDLTPILDQDDKDDLDENVTLWQGVDADGHDVTVIRDEQTGRTIGFIVDAPPAHEVAVTMDEARQAAARVVETALEQDFSSMAVSIEELADPSYPCYYFRWEVVDSDSGALLPLRVDVCICAGSGKPLKFLHLDGGQATVSTIPDIDADQAGSIAILEAADYFKTPLVDDMMLFVGTFHGQQRLVWEVIVRDSAPDSYWLWITIDAHDGEVIEVEW